MRLLLLAIPLLILSCKSKIENQQSIRLSEKNQIVLLDSIEASKAILQDEVEGFFEKIKPLDMMLQLKKNYPDKTARAEILADYQNFLQRDVEDFTASEVANIEGVFTRIFELCGRLDPDIVPKRIRLIKTKGKHYGDGAFYTREDCIIIPANELQDFKPNAFTEVMLHEIAHIYSRYNPEKRTKLYQLIGFEKLNCTTETLVVPPSLEPKILLNPDGIDYTYAIELNEDTDSSFLTLPIISSNESSFRPQKGNFFQYISFQLYPLRPRENGSYELYFTALPEQGLNPFLREDFKKKIKDNTNYIIHPDEILADNFKLLFMSKTQVLKYDQQRLSEEGKKLLQDIEKIITQ